MNLVPTVFAYLCCRSIACDVAPRFFNMFLEKNKLKDDSSNDADWVRDLRIILIAAHTTKKDTSVMIRVCHSRSRFLSCMYIYDDFMTESR